MNRIAFFLLVFLVPTANYSNPVSPVQLDNQVAWSVAERFMLFTHPQPLTPFEAFRYTHTQGGTILTNNIFSRGREPNYCWLYGKVKNNAIAKTIVLTFENPDVHRVECFRRQAGRIDTLALTGDVVPFDHRPILSNYFAIPITLKSFEEIEILVFLDKRNEYLGGKVGLYTEKEFVRYQHTEFVRVAVFLAILSYILLFNLFLFFSLRDSIHLLFIAQLVVNALIIFTALGYSRQYIWPDITFRSSAIMAIIPLLFIAINLFLMKRFLGINQDNSKFNEAIPILGWSILGYVVVCLLLLIPPFPLPTLVINSSIMVMEFFLVSFSIIVVGVLIEQIRKKSSIAYLYATAISFALLGNVYSFLARNAILVENTTGRPLTDWLIPSYLMEQIILVFGLTLRYNAFQKQNLALHLSLAETRNEINTQIMNAQDSERQRIAADLHDDLGGVIATINHQLTQSLQATSLDELKQKVRNAYSVAAQAGDKIRSIAHNLMPPDFERFGLVENVEQLIRSLNDPRFRFGVFGSPQRLAPAIELNVYRIISELIHNVQKHAQAQQVVVQLLFHPETLSVVVEDDGIGNQSTKKEKNSAGIGLKNISSRVRYVNATWQNDQSEQGTTTIIEIPYGFDTRQHPDRR